MSDPWYVNGGGNAAPTYQGNQARLWAEIRKLWQRVRVQEGAESPVEQKEWSFSGALDDTQTFPVWKTPYAIELLEFDAYLRGTSTSNALVYVHYGSNTAVATQVGPAIISPGDSSPLAISFTNAYVQQGQIVYPSIDTATDGSDLSIFVRYKRSVGL